MFFTHPPVWPKGCNRCMTGCPRFWSCSNQAITQRWSGSPIPSDAVHYSKHAQSLLPGHSTTLFTSFTARTKSKVRRTCLWRRSGWPAAEIFTVEPAMSSSDIIQATRPLIQLLDQHAIRSIRRCHLARHNQIRDGEAGVDHPLRQNPTLDKEITAADKAVER